MAQWNGRINLSDIHKAVKNNDLLPFEYAKQVAERLEQSIYADELFDIINDFKAFAIDESITFDDTDDVLEELYDWADENRIWIATLSAQ